MQAKARGWAAAGLVAAGLGVAGTAQAGLIAYQSNGVDLVYDDDYTPVGASSPGLTWVADANLFKTQYDADNTVVTQIINAVPTITHTGTVTYPSPYSITASDFDTTNGRMSWFGAMAWAEWLGSINYGGANDWRLPSALNQDGSGPCLDYNCSGSEMGHLYYTEGGLGFGQSIQASTILDDYFTHMQSDRYWSGAESAPDPDTAWVFLTNIGYQINVVKGYNGYYAWAVRPGRADVPEPASLLLLRAGLAGLGWSRRRARRPR